ncbi:substrate-binding domain-containing protein [Chromohalobacter moromii]|uniref:Substrate-binding domain-containing protein n=1 Tax=Chromohalobacter moromii TaxID=2860329 RepID=A0A9X3AXC2_9GAMM|nr:substrate-binding domain-containing protein [Chromohalobacter moromii]MCK2046304.1 substrate-binding domain-containing protein [Chromohalobacter moromii]MCT8505272.1 substrate-binding domain-containing protein [Chromohalobacter moromii]
MPNAILRNVLRALPFVLGTASIAATTTTANADNAQSEYRFVVVPKVVHPWFDQLNEGAQEAAREIQRLTGAEVTVQYTAPQSASVAEQNQILERAIATRPDAIITDLLDPTGNRTVVREALDQEIPVSVIDDKGIEDMHLPVVGSDYCTQAKVAAERLVELLDQKGNVAIMMGVPTASNHAQRAECSQAVFDSYPDIEVVATGVDNDSISTAQNQAAAIMQSHPDLDGWVPSNAAGPIGIGQAVKEAGKVGQVKIVGIDDLNQTLDLIQEGVIDSTSALRPRMMGYWFIISAWQRANGAEVPEYIDTGHVFIDQNNVEEYL